MTDSVLQRVNREGSFPRRYQREDIIMGQLGVGVAMKLKDVRRPVPVAERVGVDFPRYFTAQLETGKTPYDEVAVGAAHRLHRQR